MACGCFLARFLFLFALSFGLVSPEARGASCFVVWSLSGFGAAASHNHEREREDGKKEGAVVKKK